MAKTKNPTPKLDQNLVLYRFLLHQFGVQSLEALAEGMKAPRLEEYTEDNSSRFLHHLTNSYRMAPELADRLEEYDRNIYRYTQHINTKRPLKIRWKYFQYLSLLFAEMYLDWYFRDRDGLRTALNQYLFDELKLNKQITFQVEDFQLDDMNKVALWQATGSGKTLLMHAHVLMLEHYLDRYKVRDKYNRVLLLTPNEGLSAQHLDEFTLSNIPARRFDEGGPVNLFSSQRDFTVEVLEITKLRDEAGDKTFAVESFERNNIVLVDEGHRGSSGKEWKRMRDTISSDGFSMEYSATFGQAIVSKDKEQFNEYAKAILFDYSYRYFYRDGYGKEYRILNIKDETVDVLRQRYLVASLLTFYQQLSLYLDNRKSFSAYRISEPLMVFVGAKVNAVRTEKQKQVSDVVDVLLFLQRVVESRDETIAMIDALLKGESGLTNAQNRDIFANAFNTLTLHTAESVYNDMITRLFNATGGRGELIIEDLKGADGEIGVRVGNSDYFGLINVGDTSSLLKLCEANGLTVTEKAFSRSLFLEVNEADSPIKILIGSKKFTEGWNSWRVSSMGLMNMGKSEGSEIIQLFGRGVRLRGFQNSLKRSTRLDDEIKPVSIPVELPFVETLNIFGVQANYMEQFKEYLEEEGLPTDDNTVEVVMPVVENLGKVKLKWFTLDVPEDKRFKPTQVVDTAIPPKINRPVQLNLYTKLQALESRQSKGGVFEPERVKLRHEHIAYIDRRAVLFELERFKADKGWSNLTINHHVLINHLLEGDWYELFAPPTLLDLNDDFSRYAFIQNEVVLPLLKKYIERAYLSERERYESKYRVYTELDLNDPNFIAEYRFLIDQSRRDIIDALEGISRDLEALNENVFRTDFDRFRGEGINLLMFDRHLYRPLVYLKKDKELDFITVQPTQLNDGELDFVFALRDYYRQHLREREGLEVYLLRNQSRGRGLGFFEANNFYPDFILWLVEGEHQTICFVDPKGIRNIKGLSDPKIIFHQTVKEIESQMGDPNVRLESFIVSVTEMSDVQHWLDINATEDDFAQHHVLFMSDDDKLQRLFDAVGV